MTKHPVFYDGRVLKYIQHSEKWSLKNLNEGLASTNHAKPLNECPATNRGSCSRWVVLCHISQLHNPLLRLLSSLVVELPLLKIQPTQGCHDTFLILQNNLTQKSEWVHSSTRVSGSIPTPGSPEWVNQISQTKSGFWNFIVLKQEGWNLIPNCPKIGENLACYIFECLSTRFCLYWWQSFSQNLA